MDILVLLFLIIFVLLGAFIFLWLKTQRMFSEMFTQALDFMAQKNVGVYYPKDLREKDLMEEKDASDFVDINEISDEDFKKAVGVKEEVNG